MSPRHGGEESLEEPLVLTSVGTKGYLKFPRGFTDRYEFDSTTLPNPTAKLEAKNGRVRLIYEWSDEQMEEAAKNAPAARKERRMKKMED